MARMSQGVAITPPTGPSMFRATMPTTLVGESWSILPSARPAFTAPIAAAAQTIAMKPSRTIML